MFDSTDRRSVAYLLYSALETRYYARLSGEARRAYINFIRVIEALCDPVADHLRCGSVHLVEFSLGWQWD
jgi:hypothetical protein